ncbi:MAG TPA: PQQ-dependent dehydrogenase, methanol/ethanol family [Candidatus Acidoferrales bacterium]|nr:PQQ-dependent dehydrogenase, methanol/ethanol family [Candidatus Acidoferrales bacterium]
MRFLLVIAAAMPLMGQLTNERILSSEKEPGNWLTYSGNYSGHRYSPLDRINDRNVAGLRPIWVHQVNSLQRFETTPLVADGVMYITEPPSHVTALDTRTGKPLWKYRRVFPNDIRVCCGEVNRGVAILGDLIYVGTVDAHLVALDAKTGAVRWDTAVANHKAGYSITVAPLAIKDKIVIGMAGGEYGVRGFLDAYDAKTGKRAWRFWTVPGPGEPGHDSWAGDTWKTGSATTWTTGAYDPATNLIFWGTGNPGPDWNGDTRGGANLYSDCIVALNADTGVLKWHFQFTPHDVHDWDSTQIPILVEREVRGAMRKLVVLPNRNGFYYALDRNTGEFLLGKPYVKQTWAKGLDDSGRPILQPNITPTLEGAPVWPSVSGGNNWYSPTYSPKTGLLYVAAREAGSVYFTGDPDYKEGEQFNGGGFRSIPGEEEWGAVRALNPATAEVVWEHRLFSPPWAGLLSTAGNIVFGATNEGQFYALDAATGKPLWRFQAGGQSRSNPMSYMSDGKQYIAMSIGNALYVFGLE